MKMEDLKKHYPELESCCESIEATLDAMEETYRKGGTILLCGNGGSCADCDHIVGELMKGFLSLRPMEEEIGKKLESHFGAEGRAMAERLQRGIPAISLAAHAGVMTAFANDVDPNLIYAQMVYAYARPQDLLIGISTSGNSKNVVAALQMGSALGIRTIGLTGQNTCAMDGLCDTVIHAPSCETYRVQEYHLPIYHYLCAALEDRVMSNSSR